MNMLHSIPMPGYWYTLPEHQLLQVRAKLYYKGQLARIIVEDLTGDKRESLTPKRWVELDPTLHSPVTSGFVSKEAS